MDDASPLTGLRGFALLIIVVAGFAGADLLPAEFGFGLEQIGLMLLVVIHGYLLAMRYLPQDFERTAIVAFLGRRARSLLPVYFALLVVSIAITRWWDEWPYPLHSLGEAARAFLLVDAPGALWIVPVLVHCYLLFVIAWWALSRGLTGAAVAAVAVLATVPLLLGWGPSSHQFVSAVAGYFFAGVGLGLTWSARVEPFFEAHRSRVAVVGAVAFVLACINLPAVRVAHGWTLGLSVMAATWFDPLSALIVVTLVAVTAARPPSLIVCSAPPLQFLGRHAYVFYLVAPIALHALPGSGVLA